MKLNYVILIILLFVIGLINKINLDYTVVHLTGPGLWFNRFLLFSMMVVILIIAIADFKKSKGNFILKLLKFCFVVPISFIFFLFVSQQSILSFGDSISAAGINQKHQVYGIVKNKHFYSNHGKYYEFQVRIIDINETITVPANDSLYQNTSKGDSVLIKYYSNPSGSICIKFQDFKEK